MAIFHSSTYILTNQVYFNPTPPPLDLEIGLFLPFFRGISLLYFLPFPVLFPVPFPVPFPLIFTVPFPFLHSLFVIQSLFLHFPFFYYKFVGREETFIFLPCFLNLVYFFPPFEWGGGNNIDPCNI